MPIGSSTNGDKFSNKIGFSLMNLSESAFKQEKVFVCHMQTPPISPNTVGLQGTADLYEAAEGVFTIATNSHIIPVTNAEFLVNIVFTFEGVGKIRLNAGEIQFCTTNKELDATVIELTSMCVRRFQQFGAKFIRVNTSSGGHKCPEGDICIDMRAIQEIKNNEVYYYFSGALGINSSPILLWNYRAIGMLKPTETSIEHRALVPIHHGNSLLEIAVSQLADSRYSYKVDYCTHTTSMS